MLINSGADINAMTIGGETPIMKAAQFGHIEILAFLKGIQGFNKKIANKVQYFDSTACLHQ